MLDSITLMHFLLHVHKTCDSTQGNQNDFFVVRTSRFVLELHDFLANFKQKSRKENKNKTETENRKQGLHSHLADCWRRASLQLHKQTPLQELLPTCNLHQQKPKK